MFRKKDPVEEFWNWFSSNEERFFEGKSGSSDQDKHLGELISHGRKVAEGIAIELEPVKDGLAKMTISANGNISLFPLVEKMVSKAPRIPRWKFLAFRQRVSKDEALGLALKMDGVVLAANELKFLPVIHGSILDVIIYTEKLTPENKDMVSYGCLLIVDHILGEYDCVKKVRAFDVKKPPEAQGENGRLLPLVDLADFVDSFYKKTDSRASS